MSAEDIIPIYKRGWQIEILFKQLKQNFPLRYFYGESANAIKTKIWITLIVNLPITLVKNKIKRLWSFSGLATMIRILLMSYVSIQGFFEYPHRDWESRIAIIRFLFYIFLLISCLFHIFSLPLRPVKIKLTRNNDESHKEY